MLYIFMLYVVWVWALMGGLLWGGAVELYEYCCYYVGIVVDYIGLCEYDT